MWALFGCLVFVRQASPAVQAQALFVLRFQDIPGSSNELGAFVFGGKAG